MLLKCPMVRELDIDALVRAFQECTLPKPQWTHREHLIVGIWHLRQFGKAEALDRLRSGIRRLNNSHGVPNSESRGYHETITHTYVALLDDFLSRLPSSLPIEDSCKRLFTSRLTDKEFLFSFYSRDLLMSPEARKNFVEPDLAPVELTPFRTIRAADRKRTPWKNGGGWTEQVAVFPNNATLGSFDWRVSIAGTNQGGPFSSFPGMDRTLALLGGRLSLVLDGDPPVELTRASDPISFSGDTSASALLREGPLTDLNVITRRGRFVSTIKRCNLTKGEVLTLGSGITLVFSIPTHDVHLFEQPSDVETHSVDGGDSFIIHIEPS